MPRALKKVFITGIAGFIGFHLAKTLRHQGHAVSGIDNFNSYYSPELKQQRAKELAELGVEILPFDLEEIQGLTKSIDSFNPTHLVHLAAQAGVRYSIEKPRVYLKTNVDGFLSILEILKSRPSIKLVYASSSSVYGLSEKIPFSETDPLKSPANIYAASKIANEAMAHAYHHLYGVQATGLRYFTAYGPWGRPDMAYFLFTEAILQGKPIFLRGDGLMQRDFTYIDDIIKGTIAALDVDGCDVFNLGNSQPENILSLVRLLESKLQKKAEIVLRPLEKGESLITYADLTKSKKILGFVPTTSLEQGLELFVNWYLNHKCILQYAR